MQELLESIRPFIPTLIDCVVLFAVAIVVYFIGKRLLLSILRRAVARTRSTWDDALVEHKVFDRLPQIIPALIIHRGILAVPEIPEEFVQVVENVSSSWMILVVTLSLAAALSAANWKYEQKPESKNRPIKGFIQLAQIIIYIIGAILVIAELIDSSPAGLLSGIGAMTAVLLIVFKDTLLSLVASIQLTSQDMIRVGDWLEVPQFGADGDVVDVALYSVTVQNWDKTTTTIPTYRLISDSFKNWRSMPQSGGRRIKRSINIDLNSIRFLTDDEVQRFTKFALLTDYIESKSSELKQYNDNIDFQGDAGVNLRQLTNIGTFRAYIANYLKNHPKIHDHLTLIVRQLQPGAEGLPIEIYCFSNDTAWANYEGIQADIFDHLCAIVPEFGLSLYQKPAGTDFARLASS